MSDNFWDILFRNLPAMLMALAAVITSIIAGVIQARKINAVSQDQKTMALAVDGKMDQLIESKTAEARAKGILHGRATADNPTQEYRSLIIEDDRVQSIAFKAMLTSIDIETDIAESIDSAALKIVANKYDVIFLDPGLKDTQGVGSLNALMALTKLPIICVTAEEDVRFAAQLCAAGAANCMTKGAFDRYHLQHTVGVAIERYKRAIHDAKQQVIDAKKETPK